MRHRRQKKSLWTLGKHKEDLSPLIIKEATMGTVSLFKFLVMDVLEDFTWTGNSTALIKTSLNGSFITSWHLRKSICPQRWENHLTPTPHTEWHRTCCLCKAFERWNSPLSSAPLVPLTATSRAIHSPDTSRLKNSFFPRTVTVLNSQKHSNSPSTSS